MELKIKAIMVGLTLLFFGCNQDSNKNSNQKINDVSNPASYPVYTGDDLGATYSPDKTTIKTWAPTAEKVTLRLYDNGKDGNPAKTIELKTAENGVWFTDLDGDNAGVYYTLQTLVNDKLSNEVPGPYAKAVGVNGKRAMIIDLAKTNPTGWDADKRPPLKSFADITLYELHIRDFSISDISGMTNKGKYLAFTEESAKTQADNVSGINYIKELGVTHVHLLPFFDFQSVDETKPNEPQFNWGYDPQNYNVPEGSFSSNPNDGAVRIRELKQMIQSFHKNGLRVVMDVVYNHVGSTELNSFEQMVPGYYFRMNADTSFSNASGCGNETASDHPMMRKYMIESVKYWLTEYHIDGFRFDLMGVHDMETMNELVAEIHKIDPTIFIYGEGWTSGNSTLPEEKRAVKYNMTNAKGFAAFSDDIRDGIKGGWSDLKTKGFVSGASNMEESIKFGIVASTKHQQIDYNAVNYSKAFWSNSPLQTINYVSCHDNNTLWDKLSISVPEASDEELERMSKLANTIVLTSQGVPFLHAGVEFLRTKQMVENSYKSPDSINRFDWNLKDKNAKVVEFYKELIKMRKEHPAFKMGTTEMIDKNIDFMKLDSNIVGYNLSGIDVNDSWKKIKVVFNANKKPVKFDLGEQKWKLGFDLDEGYINKPAQKTGNIDLKPISAYVFYQEN